MANSGFHFPLTFGPLAAALRLCDVMMGETPWAVFAHLGQSILRVGEELDEAYIQPQMGVWIHRLARVAKSAVLTPPCLIEAEAEVRPYAYLRGCVAVGRGALVGHGCELKNSVLFEEAKVAHFNYVGDSLLGWRAHLGAGVILSNVRADRLAVRWHLSPVPLPTPLTKLGSVVGDQAEVGCNAVLNPGTVLGRSALVFPLSSVVGYVPDGARWRRDGLI